VDNQEDDDDYGNDNDFVDENNGDEAPQDIDENSIGG
jgi:hypothetical protein